jgi:hypothetical protein
MPIARKIYSSPSSALFQISIEQLDSEEKKDFHVKRSPYGPFCIDILLPSTGLLREKQLPPPPLPPVIPSLLLKHHTPAF